MDDRKWMEKAVAQAKLCHSEPGNVAPKVGAVVVYMDGELAAEAHRGEIDPGDHAEFTALEKKLKTSTIAGGTVFTTLEPCMSRGSDKIPCANRLCERKVGRVVIGMLDPDPSVHGKGQMLLLERGIKVQTFDPDLTNEILEMNREFIRDRQGLGFRITEYPREPVGEQEITIRGQYITKPAQDASVCLFTRRGNTYWPQTRFAILHSRTWECIVSLGNPGTIELLVARVTDEIRIAIDLYLKVGRKYKDWIGWELTKIPDGIQVMHAVTVVRKQS
jgi:pyrimidine deaminase RibD-like protein